jgi:membrane-bound serine protease (ClpP class)
VNATVVVLLWVLGMAGLLADITAGSLILGVISGVGLVASIVAAGIVWGPLEAVGLGVGTATIGAGMFKVATSRLTLGERTAEGPSAILPDDRASLVGQRGVAATLLRPAGYATIGGRRIDVVTQGDVIDAGAPIEVLSIDGPRVVVRRGS